MRSLAPFVGTVAARLRRGSVKSSDPLKLVRPAQAGCCWDSTKSVSGGFFVWGDASLQMRGYFLLVVFGWGIWLMMLGLVARRLRPGSVGDGDPPGVVRPAETGDCWDFTEYPQITAQSRRGELCSPAKRRATASPRCTNLIGRG